MLATVLAAVPELGGPEVSRTCSKFVSVSSSFGGVNSAACSDDTILGDGGVFGTSGLMFSTGSGGGSPGMSSSSALDVGIGGCSEAASSMGASLDDVFETSGATGLLNILAQVRVPSGFKLGFAGSGATVGATSAALMFSQDESNAALSVSAD